MPDIKSILKLNGVHIFKLYAEVNLNFVAKKYFSYINPL